MHRRGDRRGPGVWGSTLYGQHVGEHYHSHAERCGPVLFLALRGRVGLDPLWPTCRGTLSFTRREMWASPIPSTKGLGCSHGGDNGGWPPTAGSWRPTAIGWRPTAIGWWPTAVFWQPTSSGGPLREGHPQGKENNKFHPIRMDPVGSGSAYQPAVGPRVLFGSNVRAHDTSGFTNVTPTSGKCAVGPEVGMRVGMANGARW